MTNEQERKQVEKEKFLTSAHYRTLSYEVAASDGFDAGWNARASQWVAVSERLPGDKGWFLTTCEPPYDKKVQYEYFDGFKFDMRGAVAWMPLPEPYQPSEATQ